MGIGLTGLLVVAVAVTEQQIALAPKSGPEHAQTQHPVDKVLHAMATAQKQWVVAVLLVRLFTVKI